MFRRRDFEDEDGETLVDSGSAGNGYAPDLVGGEESEGDGADTASSFISAASDGVSLDVNAPLSSQERASQETVQGDLEAAVAATASMPPAQKKFTLADHIANQRSQASQPAAPKLQPSAPVRQNAAQTPAFSNSSPSSTRKAESSRMFEDPKTESSPSTDFSTSTDRSSKRTLVVGLETFLKGEISNCDRVVIEGGVDANMGDVQSLVIASTGSFHGSATLENAEISGVFEGDLTVRGRLLINSTGKVTGKITYGDIEVKRGGKILGEIHSVDDKVDSSAASEAASVALV